MNPHGALGLERREIGGRETVLARGELDLTNAAELDRVLATTASEVVVLDVGQLSFIDSAGIRAIDRAHRHFADEGRQLLLVAPADSRAAGTLRIAGFPHDLDLDSGNQTVGEDAPPAVREHGI
ncbi:MAG TPA: STAS domain-containing protein [Gaiellaceae bacterium]|nr:STAS domain-containing protein [Gaiellaceae bacterium]